MDTRDGTHLRKGNNLAEGGVHSVSLHHLAAHWQTPGTDSFRSRGGERKDEMGLDQQARFWATPVASPNTNRSTKSTPTQEAGKHGEYLAVQAITHWPTPKTGMTDCPAERNRNTPNLAASASTHQPGTTMPDGQPSRRVLNPRFAEMLMGWLPGWTQPSLPIDRTAFARWETASCHLLRRLLGMSSPVGQVA
jgi:hypothetical protein